MDSTKASETFLNAQAVLKETRNKLLELSNSNLEDIHVSYKLSWIPYVKDHLDFLVEQLNGIEQALRDAPAPVTQEDIVASLVEKR